MVVTSDFSSLNRLKTDFSPQDIFPKNNEAGKAIDDPDVLNPDLVFPLSVNYDYKYNGKEWQDEFGLNMYDMDMRMYDPAIARWVVMDPVIHHSMSPYNAFDNNPVFWADPSGADGENTSTSTDSSSTGITMMGIPLESMGVARIEVYGLGDGSQFNKSSNSNNDKKSNSSNPNSGDPKQVLKNTSPNPDDIIYFKPGKTMTVDGKEYKNEGSYPLKPGETWEHGFDGVAAPHISEGSVYKVNDGVSMNVSDTKVTTYPTSLKGIPAVILEGKSMSTLTGGWKSEAWLNKVSSFFIVTTNHNIDTGQKSFISSSNGMNDTSWINLFKNSGLKNASSYNIPHVYFETIQSSRQTLPILNKR